MSRTSRMLVIGDSLAAGAGEVRDGVPCSWVRPTFVDRARDRMPGWEIVLNAVPLRRTADVAAEIDEILAGDPPDVVVVATGSNDADLEWRRFIITEGRVVRNRTPIEAFREATRRVVRACVAKGAAVVLTDVLGISLKLRRPSLERAVGRDISAMIEIAGGQPKADAFAREYRAVIQSVAEELGTRYAEYGPSVWAHAHDGVIGEDGTHPSAAGHVIIDACVWPEIAGAAELVERQQGAGRSL